MAGSSAVRLAGRGWWSLRTGVLVVVGVLAGLGAWALGPRVALAIAVGIGSAGGLVVIDWLRGRLRWLGTQTTGLHASHRDTQAALEELENRLSRLDSTLEKRSHTERAALEKRSRTELAKLSAVEKRLQAELSAVEKRLRISGSGDLAALEKRLRTDRSSLAARGRETE